MKDHRTEKRERRIKESFCAEPRCKFKGQRAQQGVCFSRDTFEGSPDWSYIESATRAGQTALDEMKALWKPGRVNNRRGGMRAYVRHLESAYATHWTNEVFELDQLISLRREVALLKAKKRRTAKGSR